LRSRAPAETRVEDGAGPGRWRGGLGSIREFEFLEPTGYSVEGDGSVHPPRGLFGGGEGTRGAVILNRGGKDETELPSKFPYRKSAPGERLCLIGPCGGGYGDPAERDPAAVREDVLDGYVSEESARTLYERPAS
jgi:N-methylhydantoinase B